MILATAPRASAQLAPTNEAPRWTYADDVTTKVKERMEATFRAEDPETDAITYTVQNLPAAATAEPAADATSGIKVTWRPDEGDVGVHEIVLEASDGQHTTQKKVKLIVEEQVDSIVLPGLEYALFVPNDAPVQGSPKLGVFQGASAQFCGFCWIHRNDKRGPSHGRVYIAFDLLASTERDVSALFVTSLGFSLSLERNPSRRFLIPFFGAETGVVYQKQIDTLGMATPYAGLYLWSSGTLSVLARAGYFLPFTSGRFDQARGFRASLGFSLAFW